MNEKSNVLIRQIDISDAPFVLNSWLKSYRHASYFAKRIIDRVFYKYHHSVVTRILSRPSCTTLMAVDVKDPTVIFGFLCYENTPEGYVFHYAYVKSPFRRLGVCKELLKASELDPNNCAFSHWTEHSNWIVKMFTSLTYIPYLI